MPIVFWRESVHLAIKKHLLQACGNITMKSMIIMRYCIVRWIQELNRNKIMDSFLQDNCLTSATMQVRHPSTSSINRWDKWSYNELNIHLRKCACLRECMYVCECVLVCGAVCLNAWMYPCVLYGCLWVWFNSMWQIIPFLVFHKHSTLTTMRGLHKCRICRECYYVDE